MPQRTCESSRQIEYALQPLPRRSDELDSAKLARTGPRTPRIGVQNHLSILLVLLTGLGAARADDYDRAAAELVTTYAGRLKQLASWCDQHALAPQARITRDWQGIRKPDQLLVAMFPREFLHSDLPEDASADLVSWDQQFMQLRREQANALENLARRAVRNGRATLAFDLMLASLHENPDQETVRRLLGFYKYHDGWYTLWEINRLKAGQVWHDKYGWIPKAWVRRYEQGQRFLGGQWITVDEDARRHKDIRTGWDVETEHYVIRTDQGLEAGVALSRKLEQLYRVWKQLFLRYFASEEQVLALFDGRTRDAWARLPQHRVVFFRSRDEYNQALRPSMPNIEISIGFYQESTRRAYFFAGEGYDERTLFHEGTHQLFHESRPVAPDVGGQANFWIVEGVAMYMESLHVEGSYYVLGGLDDMRMVAARYRLLNDQFYVPLADLAKLGRKAFQSHPQLPTLYSQCAGLTHFLISHDQGRHRDALVEYLREVYSGHDNPGTLARLTGTTYDELDRQYRDFITATGMPKLDIKP